MGKCVIHKAFMLIGVIVALQNIGSITAYAKEDNDFFLRGGVQSIIRI